MTLRFELPYLYGALCAPDCACDIAARPLFLEGGRLRALAWLLTRLIGDLCC